jgi:serine/threonine-protein kinase HipA
MARTLNVYFHDSLVGQLVQDDGGQMSFQYVENLAGKSEAIALSVSLPLRKERFTSKECRGFFGGILPEESKREIIARNLGISAKNDYAMLERIGGECAGAVTFVPAGEPPPARNYDYRELSTHELAGILRELPDRPLLAGDKDIRLSLAGAQDKVALRLDGDKVCLPLGGAPSTHILKPAVARFKGVVANEAFVMQLAGAVGLPAAKVEARSVEGAEYLLVERYDRVHRTVDGKQQIERLHQEDFCQAQNIVSELKYQKEGGPSLKQCFALVRAVSATPAVDLARLLDAVIFNYLVGNNDAHGKNFSLLYIENGTPRPDLHIAPLYDLVSTLYYDDLSKDMAMKIGGEYSSEKILPGNFDQLADEAELAKRFVRERVPEMAELVSAKIATLDQTDSTAAAVAKLITARCEKTKASFANWSPPKRALKFPDENATYDFDSGTVKFWGLDGKTRVLCAISREALDDHFKGDEVKDRLKVFMAHRPAIEQKARQKYLAGNAEEDGSIMIRTADFPG